MSVVTCIILELVRSVIYERFWTAPSWECHRFDTNERLRWNPYRNWVVNILWRLFLSIHLLMCNRQLKIVVVQVRFKMTNHRVERRGSQGCLKLCIPVIDLLSTPCSHNWILTYVVITKDFLPWNFSFFFSEFLYLNKEIPEGDPWRDHWVRPHWSRHIARDLKCVLCSPV